MTPGGSRTGSTFPFYALDFEREFGRIKDYFVDEYAGRPDSQSLRDVQHLAQVRQALELRQAGRGRSRGDGALCPDRSGCRRNAPGRPRCRPIQGPILRAVRAAAGAPAPCPLPGRGNIRKAEIRAIAREQGLPVHDKPESQEICFVPDDDYLAFVRQRRPERDTAGPIVDEEGQVLGAHPGIEGFTIGQRRGLGIALGSPRYVVQIEPTTRTVTIGRRESLERIGLEAARFNWQGPEPRGPVSCMAQIRSRHEAVPATIEPARRRSGSRPLRISPDRHHPRTGGNCLSG